MVNMGPGSYKYLGNVKMLTMDKHLLLEEIYSRLANKVKTRIFFINAHCFNIAQKNKDYLKNVNDAEMVLNDGIGIELGAKMLDIKLKDNLNGTDFTPEVLRMAGDLGLKVYLVGGKPGVAVKAGENIKAEYPGIIVAGCADGYFEDSERLIKDINLHKPDVLVVGMGVPIQENWISSHLDKLDVSLVMAVGAFLDFTSGTIPRAPLVIRKLRLEWVYRMVREPKRMWKRYLIGNARFFRYIIKYAK